MDQEKKLEYIGLIDKDGNPIEEGKSLTQWAFKQQQASVGMVGGHIERERLSLREKFEPHHAGNVNFYIERFMESRDIIAQAFPDIPIGSDCWTTLICSAFMRNSVTLGRALKPGGPTKLPKAAKEGEKEIGKTSPKRGDKKANVSRSLVLRRK
jgi:hypothetical protein